MPYINQASFEEVKQHGNKLFPISFYPVKSNTKGLIMPAHWHKELEFIYLAYGAATFTIDEDDFELEEGHCIFINSGKIHSATSKTNQSKYISLVFDISLLTNIFDVNNELFNEIILGKYNIIEHFSPEINEQKNIIDEIKSIIDELDNKSFSYELVIKSKLLYIFSSILRNSLFSTPTKNKQKLSLDKKYTLLKRILLFIEKNCTSKIHLSDISNDTNLTPQYLCTFFKEMTNLSIVEYINYCRIEKATSMLKVSNLPIIDIALECGFDNISYFNRVFKKQVHCSPSEFRQNCF